MNSCQIFICQIVGWETPVRYDSGALVFIQFNKSQPFVDGLTRMIANLLILGWHNATSTQSKYRQAASTCCREK